MSSRCARSRNSCLSPILMPLYRLRQLNMHTFLGIWQIQESPEDLSAALAALAPRLVVPALKHPKRKREWLASRLLAYTLLQNLTETFYPLVPDPYGKPKFLGSPYHLSLTHSGKLTAVVISASCEVGIDLEYISTRIVSLAPKFLSDAERQHAEEDPRKLSILWSAKETLYKMYGKKNLIFKQNLQAGPVGLPDGGQVPARIKSGQVDRAYRIQYETIHDCILTYCLDEVAIQPL